MNVNQIERINENNLYKERENGKKIRLCYWELNDNTRKVRKRKCISLKRKWMWTKVKKKDNKNNSYKERDEW